MSDRLEHVAVAPTMRPGNPRWAFWRRNTDPFSDARDTMIPATGTANQSGSISRIISRATLSPVTRPSIGAVTIQKKDVLQYISPYESQPKPLLVQATPEVLKNQPAGDWRRVKLSGKVPIQLQIADWALQDSNFCPEWLRVIIVVPATMLGLPKHARNRLDARPGAECDAMNASIKSGEKASNLTTKIRLLRPRLLINLKNCNWELNSDTSRIPYAFISFTAMHFLFQRSAGVSKNEEDLHIAYDYRMCDVIHGAEHNFVLLLDLTRQKKLEWGARMWTLAEALLAHRQEIKSCSPYKSMTVSKLGMADHVWDYADALEGDHQPTRLLAAHYSSVLTLDRLELFTIALEARSSRHRNGSFSDGDIAYALTGLLHYHIDLDRFASLFQPLTKRSLANDSDHLIECTVCMFPNPNRRYTRSEGNLFLAPTEADQYHTQLWDIEPLCQVAGVGYQDQTLILNSCRGVSIR
ncbi:MAG: hypothetical protein Q9188_000647 [Gyalolechia gomerana]